MTNIHHFTFGAFTENTYILHDETGEAVIIDPGCFDRSEQTRVVDYISNNNLIVKKILLTHGHIDHVLGLAFCKRYFEVEAWLHPEDVETMKAVEVYGPNYGYGAYEPSTAENNLSEGQVISFGNTHLEVLFTPGHSPGHVVFLERGQKFIIGGDVLFKGSIGRWDLTGGSQEVLLSSIQNKLYSLADVLGADVVVYPGHGQSTTLGHEMQTNPYVRRSNR